MVKGKYNLEANSLYKSIGKVHGRFTLYKVSNTDLSERLVCIS